MFPFIKIISIMFQILKILTHSYFLTKILAQLGVTLPTALFLWLLRKAACGSFL